LEDTLNTTDLKPTSFEPGAPGEEGTIPLCVPEIRGNEWKYIKECLDTNWVSSVGSFVDRFERELAGYVGTKYAIATCNGTAALHIALLVAGVRPDDEVLVSTITFISPANAISYVGAWPVFIDTEPEYWQMDPQKVVDFLEQECHWGNGELRNRTTNRRVKAILPVHILGHPVDMDPILKVARKYNLVVIEDATESLGAKYKGRMVGTLGDIACFSFNGNKIITTGGGGMIVTDDEAWARKAKYLTTQAKDDSLEYVHNEIGYNYRLTNIQAAMGCAQLEQLGDYIAAKRRIAANYARALRDVPGITPMQEAEWAFSIFWMYTVLVDEAKYGMSSRALLHNLNDEKIQTRPLWQPMHNSPAHAGSQAYHCDVAERLNREALSLPCSVGLRTDQLAQVVQVVKHFFREPTV
jgi:perosamine synthetase